MVIKVLEKRIFATRLKHKVKCIKKLSSMQPVNCGKRFQYKIKNYIFNI